HFDLLIPDAPRFVGLAAQRSEFGIRWRIFQMFAFKSIVSFSLSIPTLNFLAQSTFLVHRLTQAYHKMVWSAFLDGEIACVDALGSAVKSDRSRAPPKSRENSIH